MNEELWMSMIRSAVYLLEAFVLLWIAKAAYTGIYRTGATWYFENTSVYRTGATWCSK